MGGVGACRQELQAAEPACLWHEGHQTAAAGSISPVRLHGQRLRSASFAAVVRAANPGNQNVNVQHQQAVR